MAERKQLILVVESTCALEPNWATIISDYLEKIISFLGTPVYTPPDYLGKRSGESHLSDAVTVAAYFKQYRISLSVISPRRISTLRSIYDAGQINPSFNPSANIWIKPDNLVLISESFMEARVALSQPVFTNLPLIQSPIRMDLPPTSVSPDNVQILEQPKLGVAAILNNISQSRRGNPDMAKIIAASMTSSDESATLPGTSTGNDYVATDVDPLQQRLSELQVESARYIKLWEGDLTGEGMGQGQPVIITRLLGYRNTKASESIYNGKVDYLVFQAMNKHSALGEMQEKKLCAVINLASQTLVLSVSDEEDRLVGMLFPQLEMVIYKPQEDQQGRDSSKGKQIMSSFIDLTS
ncbi:hypothetical protein L2E82_43190 [Cichorium intybus]|uniref:Uncharacterized protein n=1 Tax=Cichorium intybus TaxID=13427 RepID=A0ACB8ZP80_CICIN|nr:hypothetical protein L2E82_43190 [Cichorium intybus]